MIIKPNRLERLVLTAIICFAMGFFIGAMVEKGQTKAIAMDKQLSEKIELEKELKKLKIETKK
mgnify:CR=1 FL=1|tara:strand:- start:175 stop:363 length:189 start_codon:yes stop_codon:yes gene_type:complete